MSLTPPALLRAVPAPATGAVEIGGSLETGKVATDEQAMKGHREQWFIGAYWHHLWIPQMFQKLFFEMAPSISTGLFKLDPNIGVVGTWRNVDGFAVQFGLGYMDYHFAGYFQNKSDPDYSAEYVKSTLGFWHGTAAALWSVEIVRELAFEFGFGIDLGIVSGTLERTEAYYDRVAGGWKPCQSAGNPKDPNGTAANDYNYMSYDDPNTPYCGDPITVGATTTDPPDKFGEHYHVKVKKWSGGGDIPNVFLIPTVPMLTLRFAPIPEFIIKWEFGYSVLEFWTGFSIHGAVWTAPPPPPAPPELRVVERPEVPAPAPVKGRVKGLVVEEGTSTAVGGASVTFTGRPDLSPILTLADGSFTSYEFDPGEIAMEITHPDYNPGSCNATIPPEGGDVQVTCALAPKPRVGIIDGLVIGPSGPVPGAAIDLSGPMTRRLTSDVAGTFKVEDAAPGNYEARAIADGYMVKVVQFAVVVKETVTVKIELTEMPKLTLVKVEEKEIKIEQQINFATNSAVIKPESTPLMNQIADAFLRYPDIKLVEIQGHTDSRGTDAYNLDLSQRRAESVRAWLISAGVSADRMESKGYGESMPLTTNKTREGRARNRRVQFIIKQREKEFK